MTCLISCGILQSTIRSSCQADMHTSDMHAQPDCIVMLLPKNVASLLWLGLSYVSS